MGAMEKKGISSKSLTGREASQAIILLSLHVYVVVVGVVFWSSNESNASRKIGKKCIRWWDFFYFLLRSWSSPVFSRAPHFMQQPLPPKLKPDVNSFMTVCPLSLLLTEKRAVLHTIADWIAFAVQQYYKMDCTNKSFVRGLKNASRVSIFAMEMEPNRKSHQMQFFQ